MQMKPEVFYLCCWAVLLFFMVNLGYFAVDSVFKFLWSWMSLFGLSGLGAAILQQQNQALQPWVDTTANRPP